MAAVIYGATDTGTTGDLYQVDPSTGTPTSIGSIGFCVQAMAEDPTDGMLYAVVADDDPSNANWLITIDKTTGAGTLVGDTTDGALVDLAFDSAGNLYAVQDFIRRLYSIDKVTGAATLLGAMSGSPPNAATLAADSSDNFYAQFSYLDGGDLRTVDIATHTATHLIDTSNTIGGDVFPGAMSFDSSDVLYMTVQDQDTNLGYLGTLDIGTGAFASIGQTGSVYLKGMTWGTGTAPPPPAPARRFFGGYPWRFIVTDLNTETITFLDRLATARQVSVGRNVPRTAQGTVPSDSPEVNILHTDGDPFLNEGNRLIYGFRREGWVGSVGPWVCRMAGPLLHLEDNAQTDAPASPWIAMDPWALLYRRPVRLEDGDLPGPDGRVFLAADSWTYQEIAYQLLLDSITYDGTCFIDPTGGTIVTGPVITEDVTLQQGLSVGAAWDQLCATGKTDIELDPIYDPVGRPGMCCVFTAKPVIGMTQNAAVFAWDLPSRSLTDISRVTDGTGRANTIQYYFGQGGPPVSQQIDAGSVAKFGEYWEQQFWPGFKEAGPVTAMAARRLALVKNGVRTFTFAPAPERSPIPFDDYNPGDWAPFFASKKLRAPLQPTLASGQWTNIPRIEAFTLDIADNQTETVSPLLVSMDIQP